MAVSFKYWDDCTDPEDIEALWAIPEVRAEWIDAGETMGSKIQLARDPEGQAYLTQTEIKAVAGIIVQRYFVSEIDSDILCAIATLQSDRQLLYTQYTKKSKETSYGMLQILPKTAEWLAREGYTSYAYSDNPNVLYRPFVNVYFAAAYLKWLSTFDNIERNEEFMVRAYKGGTKKAAHKSTLLYWKRYISVKESLPSSKKFEIHTMPNAFPAHASAPAPAASTSKVPKNKTWDSRTSQEDMEAMWNQPSVSKEWHKEKKGRVRLSHDSQKKPYLSRVELRAVAEIILSKHFSSKSVKPAVLCAICEMVSMRFVDGVGQRVGLMGIDISTAQWLYEKVGCKAYQVESVEDLKKPFVSMYFGAAYLAWLADYDGRERTPQFIVQAYLTGPQNVNIQETSPQWLKFEEALSRYQDSKKEEVGCTIL